MNVSPVSFTNQYESPQVSKKGGASKAMASALLPGLGQFLEDRNKKGAAFLSSAATLGTTSILLASKVHDETGGTTIKTALKNAGYAPRLSTKNKAMIACSAITAVAAAAIYAAGIYDAYRGEKENISK